MTTDLGPDRPLRIAVDALNATTGGGITVTQNLTREMATLRPQHRFKLYYSLSPVGDAPYPENVEQIHLPGCKSAFRRWRWEQISFPKILKREEIDVLLCLAGFTIFGSRVPQVSIWQNANAVNRVKISRPLKVSAYIWLQRQLQGLSLRKAAMNVFLTREFARLAGSWWSMQHIPHCVIYNGIDPARVAKESRGPWREGQHIALTVGNTYFHKNYETLIDAMERYRARYADPLVLRIVGGSEDPAYHAALERRIREKGLSGAVEMVGPAGAERVASNYSEAKLYVVTSLLESFGLTTLEAMANGVPVLAPNATCFPEVCLDAALYCDPMDPDDIAEKLHRIACDETLQQQLRERGFERVAYFSWERCAREYLREIEAASAPAAGIPERAVSAGAGSACET